MSNEDDLVIGYSDQVLTEEEQGLFNEIAEQNMNALACLQEGYEVGFENLLESEDPQKKALAEKLFGRRGDDH